MKQATTIRNRFYAVTAFIVGLLLVLSSFGTSLIFSAKAEETDTDNWSETLAITNSQFADTESGSNEIPAPSSWTGASISGSTSSVISGVMDLDAYAQNEDKYKLDEYDEFESVNPSSPFGETQDGKPVYEGTNKNVLLINADNNESAYGYTSASFSLVANAFYKISAWVYTGGLGDNGGAAILLSGVEDEPVGFTGIDTKELAAASDLVNSDEGWYKYTLYVRTDALAAATASLSLQLGHDGVGGQSKGFAMFDNVTASRLSAKTFFEDTASAKPRTLVVNCNDAISIADGDFAGATVNAFGESQSIGQAFSAIVNSATTNADTLGLENGITLPTEKAGEKNALAITTYNAATDSFETAYGYVKSNPFTINRYSNYRISAWYKGESIEGGDGISAKLHYRKADYSGEYASVSATALTNDDSNPDRNGWNELVIFVKGSDFATYEARLELALGTKENPTSGAVLWDDVTIQRILPADYSANSSTAKATADLNSIITDGTGITNGSMNAVGEFTEYNDDPTLPYLPSGWTMFTTDKVETEGYSAFAVSTDDAVSGLVAVESIDKDIKDNAPVPMKSFGNALKLSSSTATAYCYQSNEFSAAENSYNVLTASVYVDELSGYGASLVLKKAGKVVSTIENITSSGKYSFYIKGAAEASAMKVEIWMGMLDRTNNASKLASGTFYVSDVTLDTSSTAEVFDAKATAYKSIRISSAANGTPFATVDLTDSFTLFDGYDNGAIKTPYAWSINKGDGKVNYGIIDAKLGLDNTIKSSYDNGEKQYAVVLNNATPTYSFITLDNAIKLAADSYYKITVSAKVDIPEEYINSESAIGAYIKLSSGDEFRFDFKDTSETVDSIVNKEIFRTFTFFVKAPAQEATTSVIIGLGGADKTNQRCTGWVYINDVTVSDLTQIDYDEAVTGLEEGAILIDPYTMRVDLSTESTEEEAPEEETVEQDPSVDWWLIPSILLAVALLLAIVGAFVRKAIENRPKKTTPTGPARPSYDRSKVNYGEDTDAAESDAAEENTEEVVEPTAEETEETPEETAAEEEPTEEVAQEEYADAVEPAPAEETPSESSTDELAD